MPIPKPKSGEEEKEYVSRCMSAIGGEFPQKQAAAICYSTYREARKGIAVKFLKTLAFEAGRQSNVCKKYNDPVELKIKTTESTAVDELIPLLELLQSFGQMGHSTDIVVDPDASEYRQWFGFDGDGPSMIEDIQMTALEKARTIDGYESPEPGDIPEKEKEILARVYSEQRKKGMDKERAAKIAWGAVRQYRESKK